MPAADALLVELEAALNVLKDENQRLRAFVAAVRAAIDRRDLWQATPFAVIQVQDALKALEPPDGRR